MTKQGYHQPPNERRLARIEAELAGQQPTPRKPKPWTLLSDADMEATMAAFIRTGGNLEATARLMNMHLNTVKYRLKLLRERLGVPKATVGELLVVAVRAGLDDPEAQLRRFVLWSGQRALREEGRVGLVLHDWLLESLDAWEQMHAEKARKETVA